MMRILLFYLALCTSALAQGINPISPPVNDLMEVVTPSAANPSRNYTTPMRLQSGGSAPTLSGSCSVLATTQKGGNAIGQFTIPSGNCATTTTITLTFATTATNGWYCSAHDVTTTGSAFQVTAQTTTTVQFTIATTNASSGDIIQFRCAPY